MQAPDGSSPGARSALMAIATDLSLPPLIVARALEYAFDNLRTFPSASQALCFGIVRQGYYVDTQLMDLALQRLRRNFGVILGRTTLQHVPIGQWFARPTAPARYQVSYTATTAPIQASITAGPAFPPHTERPSNSDEHRRVSIMSSFPRVGSWPMPQSRRSSPGSQVRRSSVGADSVDGEHHAKPSGSV